MYCKQNFFPRECAWHNLFWTKRQFIRRPSWNIYPTNSTQAKKKARSERSEGYQTVVTFYKIPRTEPRFHQISSQIKTLITLQSTAKTTVKMLGSIRISQYTAQTIGTCLETGNCFIVLRYSPAFVFERIFTSSAVLFSFRIDGTVSRPFSNYSRSWLTVLSKVFFHD